MFRFKSNPVSTPVAHLVGPGKIKIHNARLAYSTGDGSPLRIDDKTLQIILCYGPVSVSDDAFELLFKQDISVCWLTRGGRKLLGRIEPSRPQNVALRLAQYDVCQRPETRLQLARETVLAKIDSQLEAARHYQRQGRGIDGATLQALKTLRKTAETTRAIDQLLGLEGSAATHWFGIFGSLLSPPWTFPGRVRRPPTDPVNALLSLGYTFLCTRLEMACATAGLELSVGALHTLRPGRPSLACDLMESFRVPVVDRWVLAALCQRREFQLEDFTTTTTEGTRLTEAAFPRFLASWETHWQAGNYQTAVELAVRQWATTIRQLSRLPELDSQLWQPCPEH